MVADERVGKILPLKIEEEMRHSYLDYAMSVIVQRAIPDVRDGLKPVQRRILYTMHDLGMRPGTPYRKSAKVAGDTMGRFHPHGDQPIYEALVRMAQDFSLRYPLIDGQGNFGSVDGDPPASMRYTEARLAAIAEEMLVDIDKETVDFVPNYDNQEEQPSVLPARLPNMLVNGASGIAVGMATNIPPQNLSEICDAIVKLIDQPEVTTDDLLKIVKGPDFPTAGIIIGREGIKNAYATGQGKIILRARTAVEEMGRGDRMRIVVSELPFQVNKAQLIIKMAELVKDKRIDGISDIRDESDRDGMRIVIELSRSAQPKTVLNTLYKHTSMQTSFSVNMLCLVDGQPKTVNLLTALKQYLNFRREVIRRRTEYELAKARDREHILAGLVKALDKIDAIIRLIRGSASAAKAREGLMERPFQFSERQAQAILDMQLSRLAALEREKIQAEYKEVIQRIAYLEDLLANARKIDAVIREEIVDLKKKYGDARRTQVVAQELEDFSEEDLIPDEAVVVTLSQRGYIKRLPLETYRRQRRGGRGITGMVTREDDAVRRLIVANTHDQLLVFTDRGRVFSLKIHEVPDAGRTAKGIPLINVVDIAQGELVTAFVATRAFEHDCLIMGTKMGEVKRTRLSEFAQVRRNGLIAMNLESGDELISARLARSTDDILMVSAQGQSVRFKVDDLRMASRQSGGVRGMRLAKNDHVVAMEIVDPKGELLSLSEKGFGKRTPAGEYPRHNRGGGGVKTFNITTKTGPLVAAKMVNDAQDLMLISRDGIVIRTTVSSIRRTGRAASGVSVMSVGPNDAVASIATIDVTAAPGAEPEQPAKSARSETARRAAESITTKPGSANGGTTNGAGKVTRLKSTDATNRPGSNGNGTNRDPNGRSGT
jgi:DNA gyrase subunit A